MSALQQESRPRKVCFVTIGATAAFDSLIEAALTPPFLEALQTSGYTDLRLQHGTDGRSILKDFKTSYGIEGKGEYGIAVSGFDFNKQGLGSEMRAAKGEDDRTEGVVISHAGKSRHAKFHARHEAHHFCRLWLDPWCSSNRCPAHRGA